MSTTTRQELVELKAEIRAWLKENKPAKPDFLLPQTFMEVGSEEQLDFLRTWQYKVWSAGYLGMAWPKEYGGQGLSAAHQTVVDTEMRNQRVPIMFNVIGLGWAGPLINHIGSDIEKDRYLKNILSGEDIWCQGFSEPDHGSDLGSAQLSAVRDGDEYVLNGTKTWTTFGNYAKHMILLARTNPTAERRYDGLSFFLAPMQAPGIDPRPIKKLTGEYGFTETFFTDARIPADCLMGHEGQGWKIAMQTLQYERGAEAGAAGGLSMVPVLMEDLLAMAATLKRDGKSVLEDSTTRDQLVDLMIDERANNLGIVRGQIRALCDDYPHSIQLSNKLRFTEFARGMRQCSIGLQGAKGALYVGDHGVPDGGFWQRAYLNNFSTTIGGGTSQVQANIVAETILGLPK
jgi:alkylation response protein AidB-like acyl-CoA dehydrogenase